MSTPSKPFQIPFSLAFLVVGLASAALPAAAQSPTLAAETYGRASGDAPHPELGLVLELVDPGTPDARLRLFGGLPGHPATIVISATPAAAPAGASGAVTLVGPAASTHRGTFDWSGSFELSLSGLGELPAGATLYAQGLHAGILDLGDGPLVQLSHGLAFFAPVVPAEDDEPLAFDDFLPHLPEARDLAGTSGFAERLQQMLDSSGDSVRIAVEVEVTAGLGIEVVDAKAGGKLGFEFELERTTEGLYEVGIAADIAALAGVSAGTGAEVGADLSGGYGARRLFRFHSAPGAARGMLGLVLALRFPELQPGRLLEGTGILGDAGARVQELQELVSFLQGHAAELEAFLWQVLDAQVRAAESARSSALARLSTANRNYANAPWYLRAAYWAQVVVCRAALAGAEARLTLVRAARVQAEAAVELAQQALAARRAELLAAVQEVTRIGRIAGSIAQLRGWTTDHYAGSEVRHATALEVEAKVKAPVVDLKNFGAGVSGELEREFVLRWEPAQGDRPARATVAQTLQLERKAWAGLLIGGEFVHTRTLEVADAFELGELGSGASTPVGRTISLTSDACVVGAIGLVVAAETGVGRTRSFTFQDDQAFDLASLTSPEALAERFGAAEIGLELQDRRQRNLDTAFAVDVSGNGGGIEIELEWADQGRLLSRSTPIAEGLARILTGAAEVIDVETGTVLLVE